MNVAAVDLGSFRDPSGRVYFRDGRVYRTVMPCAADDFEYVEASGLVKKLEAEGLIVETAQVDPSLLGEHSAGARKVLEHPRLPFISYPYEWSFSALKAASLAHLDIHIRALEHGVTLSDASAYNMQFVGPNPIFIDRLSFKRYREGDFWTGHRQFCEQFLNPLLLRSLFGVPHNPWYRGTQEGVRSEDLTRILPWTRKFSLRILKHVVLPSAVQKRATRELVEEQAKSYQTHQFPLKSYQRMLLNLRDWISGLEPKDTGKTVWGDYSRTHSYSGDEVERKLKFVNSFIRAVKPKLVWDLGCNTGDYSAAALEACAENVIGFDFDQTALEVAFSRAIEDKLAFLPLYLDVANPTPNQGWAERERRGLRARADAGAILVLAFTHHLAIGCNIAMPDLLDWLISLSPHGVTEFVPKSDPRVQDMLRLREDIFPDYTLEHFLVCVEASADIVETELISKSGRCLVRYSRCSPR